MHHSKLNVSNYFTVCRQRAELDKIASTFGTCRYKVVVFFVVIWCAAEFHFYFPLPFIIGFIACINYDNEGPNTFLN